MLKLPENSTTIATIVGIDPGTESLGFSELDFDLRTLAITRWEPRTYIGSKLLKGSAWVERVHGARMMRLQAHGRNLVKLFDQLEPYVIACESPFINMKRPQAYGALTEIVYQIRLSVMTHNAWKELYLIEPSTVKNSVGAKGNADKDAIKASIMSIPELAGVCTRPIIELDEHELDSGAVAYAAFKNLKSIALNAPV
jgi:Holliday junction resolvasome RuvABC endonuclease subunit